MTTIHELYQGPFRIAHIQARPAHCDRGRWHVNIEIGGLWISESDPWPRYYFNLDAAKSELLEYLKAKKADITNIEWREVQL